MTNGDQLTFFRRSPSVERPMNSSYPFILTVVAGALEKFLGKVTVYCINSGHIQSKLPKADNLGTPSGSRKRVRDWSQSPRGIILERGIRGFVKAAVSRTTR